ncbi:MAG: outer membrane beta-barrel protein [Saprospiraceae bacterium]
MKKIILVLLIGFVVQLGNSQSVGIRAGLNYSKFNGPVIASANEKYSFASGFHFGINYNQLMTDKSYLRFEILYTQIGSKYNYNGPGYYYIRYSGGNFYEYGNMKMNLDISNAYLSLPITYHYQVTKKIELHAGVYGGILVAPRGSGTLDFDSYDEPNRIFITQSLDYNYGGDVAGGGTTPTTLFPHIYVGEDVVTLPSFAGAYYQYQEKDGNRFRWFDAGVSVGGSYFFNRGFYGGLRFNYGLVDITRMEGDVSFSTLNEANDNAIHKTTNDKNFGFEVSLGFKF